jgi:hypothetical protein
MLNLSDWKSITDIAESVAKIVAVAIGGVWVYYRFVRTREDYPKVNFAVGLEFVGVHNYRWLTEVVAEVENRGLVEHEIHNFRFELFYLSNNDDLEQSRTPKRPQTVIPRLITEGH